MNDKMKKVAAKMKKIDFCLMTTMDGQESFDSRPMSNNGDVEYDGDSWFFSFDDDKAEQIRKSPMVSLAFQGDKMLFIHISGTGSLITDKAIMKKHWQPELKRWFPEGIETKGIVLIKVTAKKIKYWKKEEEFEIVL